MKTLEEIVNMAYGQQEYIEKLADPEILSKLADISQGYIRYYVARNPFTPRKSLEKLIWTDAAYEVAKNLNCPIDLLRHLAYRDSHTIRDSVASNPNCSIELLVYLAKDEYSSIRYEVASNPSTPYETLIVLACDDDIFVRRKALDRI